MTQASLWLTHWILPSTLSAEQDAVKRILGMPEDALQTVMLPVGYTKGAVLKRAERLPAGEVTFANSWNEPIGE